MTKAKTIKQAKATEYILILQDGRWWVKTTFLDGNNRIDLAGEVTLDTPEQRDAYLASLLR